MRVDPAPGFQTLANDKHLLQHQIILDIGRIKNINKNPVAEKAIQELIDELQHNDPGRSTVTRSQLAICVAQLNSCIRNQGVSAREL